MFVAARGFRLSSINLAVMLVCGCGIGVLVLGRYPDGLDPFSGYVMLGLAACSLVCALVSKRSRKLYWASLLIAFALLGCGRSLAIHPPANRSDLAFYNYISNPATLPPTFLVAGSISAEPVYSDKSQQVRVSAESLSIGGASPLQIHGDLLAIIPPYPQYSYGERLLLEGTITAPPILGDFDYATWLAHQGVYSYMQFPHVTSVGHDSTDFFMQSITNARAKARDAIRQQVAEPQAGLAVGVVIGDRKALPDDIVGAFRRTGTTHILAISGENITALIGVIWIAWSRRFRRSIMPLWVYSTVIIFLVTYTAFTGATPSVIRAAIMGAIFLLAPIVHRRYDPIAAIALAGAGMVWFEPYVLLDAGFQLSFLAMWGLVIFAPAIAARLVSVRIPGAIAYPFAVGFATQLSTLPLAVVLSHQFPIVSLFATVTMDVVLVYVMFAGIATAGLGALSIPFLPWIFGMATWFLAGWMLWWVEWWAALPFAAIPVEGFTPQHALAYYAALFAGVWLFSESNRRNKLAEMWPRLRVAALGAAAVGVWAVAIAMIWAK